MLLLIILSLGFLKVLVLYKGFHILPIAELKRKSRGRDPDIAKLFKVAAFGRTLDFVLWLFGVVVVSAVLVMSAEKSAWLVCTEVLTIGWLLFWAPRPQPGGIIYKYTVLSAPYMYKFMLHIRPPVDTFLSLFPAAKTSRFHTGVYEKADLLEIITNQKNQLDNRVNHRDLEIAYNALTFGYKKVIDIMTSRSKIRFVNEDEDIGPMLMDELHATGQTVYPVISHRSKPAEPDIIGTLYLEDLIANPDKSKVGQIHHATKAFINEDLSLEDALEEFVKRKTSLLIVANNFEEVVGAIAFDKVIEQIIGQKIVDQVDPN